MFYSNLQQVKEDNKTCISCFSSQGLATLTISAVPDLEPEEKESYFVELLPPDSGANLGSATRRLVSIERNDAPYGLLEIFPASNRYLMILSLFSIIIHSKQMRSDYFLLLWWNNGSM